MTQKEGEATKGETMRNTINIAQQDFGTLCICALRYCHGRRTYMPSMVQDIVRKHFDDLSAKDLRIIAKDEQFQRDMDLWGDACDKQDWYDFYLALEEYRGKDKL